MAVPIYLSYTAGDLIKQALEMVGVNSPSQPIDGATAQSHLRLFNYLIGSFNSSGQYIPYFTELDFTITANKDTYVISDILPPELVDVLNPRLIDVRYCNIFLNNISFPVQIKDRSAFYDLTRITVNATQPIYLFINQKVSETSITFYPVPISSYQCKIQAKMMLATVKFNDTILSFPGNYALFLTYALARMFDDIYAKNRWSPKQEADYQELRKQITVSNDIDIAVIPSVCLSTSYYDYSYWPYYWPQVG